MESQLPTDQEPRHQLMAIDDTAQIGRDAEECDLMDGQPLDDSSEDTFWSAEEHDSQGFDSDSDDTTQHETL